MNNKITIYFSLLIFLFSILITSCGRQSEDTLTSSILSVDYEALISRADITYNKPVTRSEAGLPVGNGRMGCLVWTQENTLNLQINRVDVFAQNSYSISGTDYCCGVGRLSINFGAPVFSSDPAAKFIQSLSVYDGLMTIETDLVKIEVIAYLEDDVIALRISDLRDNPSSITVDISMLRDRLVKTEDHTAFSTLIAKGEKAVMVQEFTEREYFCRSVMAVGISGRESGRPTVDKKNMWQIVPAGGEPFTILISTAASFDQSEHIEQKALDLVNSAARSGFTKLYRGNKDWWQDFWQKSFVHISSPDSVADFLERIHTYHLYLMASSSRGTFPPKFNGMIWNTNGDLRKWGSQFWLWNQETMYFPLFASNHLELTDPHFNMYSGMMESGKTAAMQRWGSKGVYIPETVAFNGPEILPDDIAHTFRAILYGKIPYEHMPAEFRKYGESVSGFSQIGNIFHSKQRWAWITQIVSSSAEIAVQFYQRYQMTGDIDWLRNRAYPFLKETMEFYRNLPALKKEDDGFYHLYNTNVHEVIWGVKDGIMDLAAIRGTAPLAIKAAQILEVDEDLREHWQEFLKNLAPYPMGGESGSFASLGPGTWAACRKPTGTDIRNVEQIWLTPVYPFETWTLETLDESVDYIAYKTYDNLPARKKLYDGEGAPVWSRMPIFAARMGLAKEVENLLPLFLAGMPEGFDRANSKFLPNALGLWEGEQTMCAEHTGLVACALQEAQLQCLSPAPGEPPVIHLYPAWPGNWNSQFSLRARGGFIVTSEYKNGTVQFVEITSLLGNVCRLRNPWKGQVDVYREGKIENTLSGDVLELSIPEKGQVLLFPSGKIPGKEKTVIAPIKGGGIWKLQAAAAGKEFQLMVGIP